MNTKIKKGEHLSFGTEFKKGQICIFKGVSRSKENIEKQKETIKNRTEEEKRIISKNVSDAGKGKHNSPSSEFKKGGSPWNKGKSYTLGIHKSEECKKKISNSLIGHPISRPKRKELRYKETTFRSSWELFFAKYLDSINEPWLYESKQFHLGDSTYTPDFFIINHNLYIEIKGYWWKGYREKINKFKQLYPNEKLILFDYKPPYLFSFRPTNL